jgi:hypothetical protein
VNACESPFPPGLVVIVSSDLGRFTDFNKCLLKLLVPAGSQWEWASGTSIEGNRNLALTKMKDHCEWIYTIDDDHGFEPDILLRLLDRMTVNPGVDILQGLCQTKKPPYLPYAYRRDPAYHGYGVNYINARWDELPPTGISEWDAVGTGGMLIRRSVIDRMKYPWFEVGRTFKDALGEDLYFCTKAKELGFRVWVDSENRTSHMTTTALSPAFDEESGEWITVADMGKKVLVGITQNSWAHARFDEIHVPKELEEA